MYLYQDNFAEIADKVFTLKCPHCGAISGITIISPPNFSYLRRYQPPFVGMAYICNACKEPIFLKFKLIDFESHYMRFTISDTPIQIEFPKIDFEFEYLPEIVKADFKEALSCYSIGSYNAFAAMCRRTIQSTATDMGAKGKDKVQRQIQDLKDVAEIDEETYDLIKQIILDGHDGSHPHLPTISTERSKILLELIVDVMYQLYVRKGKLKRSAELRNDQLNSKP